MKITIDYIKGEFYLHFVDTNSDLVFSANPRRLSLLLTKDQLTQLADFANAELKDLGVANV